MAVDIQSEVGLVNTEQNSNRERRELRGKEIPLHGNGLEVKKPAFIQIGGQEFLSVPHKIQENGRVINAIRVYQGDAKPRDLIQGGTVGRGTQNAVVVADEKASRNHAYILPREEGMYITDLHSANGTKITEVGELADSSQGEERLTNESLLFFLGKDPVELSLGSDIKYLLEKDLRGNIYLHEKDSGKRITIPQKEEGIGEISVGRSETNDVIISNPGVSREHLKLITRGPVVEVVDHSTNGTVLKSFEAGQNARDNKEPIGEMKVQVERQDAGKLAALREKFRVFMGGKKDQGIPEWRDLIDIEPARNVQDVNRQDNVEWNRSMLVEQRLEEHFFEEPEIGIKDIPEKLYQGKRIISRDRPINGGIYLGGSAREGIVVDDTEEASILPQQYKEFIDELHNNNISEGNITDEQLVTNVYAYVKKHMPYNSAYVNQIGRNVLPDQPVNLDTYINKGGVCRHQALFAGYLAEKFLQEHELSGKISVDRNYVKERGGHGWARYTGADGQVYIIDVAQGYHGKIENVKEGIQWFYRRPGEK